MFKFKTTEHDYKYSPRLGRRFYIQYAQPNLTLDRVKMGWISKSLHILKLTIKWWLK